MALRARVEYLRKERKELLELVDRIEEALTLAYGEDVPGHEDGLARLRALERKFEGIAEHCHSEERIVESTLHELATQKERIQNDEQHREILRKLAAFRTDLQFATVDRLREVCVTGNDMVSALRTHVGCEADILERILGKARSTRRRKLGSAGRPVVQLAPRKPRVVCKRTQEHSHLSYLMEDHPEL